MDSAATLDFFFFICDSVFYYTEKPSVTAKKQELVIGRFSLFSHTDARLCLTFNIMVYFAKSQSIFSHHLRADYRSFNVKANMPRIQTACGRCVQQIQYVIDSPAICYSYVKLWIN